MDTRLGQAQRFGLMAEKWVVSELTKRGYEARLISMFTADSDILISGGVTVEVKISHCPKRYVRPGYSRPYFGFDLNRLPRHRDSIVVLICQDVHGDWYPFIAPSWYFFGRYRVNITSHPTRYRGYLSDCLNRWDNVANVLARAQKNSPQLPLYDSDGCVGRCDARCYNAKTPDCDCICGGKNHAAGINKAGENTMAMAQSWIDRYNQQHPGEKLSFKVNPSQMELPL